MKAELSDSYDQGFPPFNGQRGGAIWRSVVGIKDLDCFALFKMEERKLSDSAHPSHDESMEEGGLSSTVKPSPPISLKELALTHGVEGKTFRAIGR